MVMRAMVVIIPQLAPPLPVRGKPHDRRGVSGRPYGRCPVGKVLALGGELGRRAHYSVFYGHK